ncbi:hypothetical protein OKW35_002441 [Paraburkholderia sp. MM5477-R1]
MRRYWMSRSFGPLLAAFMWLVATVLATVLSQ